jgi:hypothetical protein
MTQPLVTNAADDSQLKEAKAKEHNRDRREKNDWIAVMQSDQGFRVLMEILRFSKLEECPMGGADRDIFYRIGRQEMGRFVKAKMITADRKKYFEMELKIGDQK